MTGELDLSAILTQQKARIETLASRQDVLGDIHQQDMLFDFLVRAVFPVNPDRAIDAYFEGGEDCCRRFAALCGEHGQGNIKTVLEFASGYGRVARHAHRFLPETDWTCCDIHPEAVDYARSQLGMEAILSAPRPEAWDTGGRRFDVVFALSFFSHMPDATFGPWLARLLDAVAPGGLLIFTTHGEVSAKNSRAGGWLAEFDEAGYFWNSASDQRDISLSEYGTSMVTLAYVHRALENLPSACLIRYQQAFWWAHQDLYVVRRAPYNPQTWWSKDEISARLAGRQVASTGVDFGGLFLIEALSLERKDDGVQIDLWWKPKKDSLPGDWFFFAHLVDDTGAIIENVGFRLSLNGDYAFDRPYRLDSMTVSLPAGGAQQAIAFGINRAENGQANTLLADCGNRDWDNHRVVVPLP